MNERYEAARQDRAHLARHICEADGLHHPDCPGRATRLTASQFVTHHVLPRGQGGPDAVGNLRFVWNGPTGLGAAGCHGRIHAERKTAKALGLLEDAPDKWAPKKGILHAR